MKVACISSPTAGVIGSTSVTSPNWLFAFFTAHRETFPVKYHLILYLIAAGNTIYPVDKTDKKFC